MKVANYFTFIFVYFLLQLVAQATAGNCTLCNTPISTAWTGGEPQYSCGQDEVTYENAYCPRTISDINICLIANNITGIQYAGPCGCPNNCMVDSKHGTCMNGSCQCNVGWKGSDCSQVDCSAGNSNTCNNHGTCTVVQGIDICNCTLEWAGSDCSSHVISLPPIIEVVPSTQYSSEDEYGNDHPIFNSTTVAQIRLTMSEESLQYLLNPANSHSQDYQKSTMWFDNGIVSKYIAAIGVRLKGNSSRGYAKKSWKLSFTEYDDDADWDGIHKLALKGFQTDPSYLRDPMATSVAYSMNAYIQRFGWAELYINNQSYGYYLINEEVNKQYLTSRFGTNDGPLYKCTANLTWVGPEPSDYQNLYCGSDPCYKPETKEAEDYTQLRNLLAVMNLTPNDVFAATLPSVFDVDLFIRTFVFEVATGNWDGLRENPVDGLWKYIRHDNDITFGQLPIFMNVSTNDIYTWGDGTRGNPGRFLYDRILAIPEFKFTYSKYLQELFDLYFEFNEFSAFREIARDYEELSTMPVVRDVAHYLDSGFTYRTFNNSFYQTIQRTDSNLFDGAVVLSFSDFMTQRKTSAEEQLSEYFKSLN